MFQSSSHKNDELKIMKMTMKKYFESFLNLRVTLQVIRKKNDSDQFKNQVHITPSQLTSTNHQPTQRRKANQIDDSEQSLQTFQDNSGRHKHSKMILIAAIIGT
ncbi:unnamed protein product [Rotaria socialis]|uniref:Uncharacterized protein n=1 Tax=Rotaria socialis TaxID=392032 RepID=A0A819X6U7_9BILA|nr:unnamed protein product [Rotaria socialis]CAF4747487.1 unnamed protein product [Rotaria socialis]